MQAEAEVAAWLKGAGVRGSCELVVVKEWRPDIFVLLCLEPTHDTHSKDLAELRARGILATHENTVEFSSNELAILSPILKEMPGKERWTFRNNLLTLKLSFAGAVIPVAEFQRQVDVVLTGLRGFRSPAASPAKTTSSASARPASDTHRNEDARRGLAFKQRLGHLARGALFSQAHHLERAERTQAVASPPTASSSPASSSFAERLKKRAQANATAGGATPVAPTS